MLATQEEEEEEVTTFRALIKLYHIHQKTHQTTRKVHLPLSSVFF